MSMPGAGSQWRWLPANLESRRLSVCRVGLLNRSASLRPARVQLLYSPPLEKSKKMDCVYTAWSDNLAALGMRSDQSDRAVFNALKLFTHGTLSVNTHHAAVPFILSAMCARRGLLVSYQHMELVRDFLAGLKLSPAMRIAFLLGDFAHHGTITFTRAIYCSIVQHHAYYAHKPMKNDDIGMAAKITRRPK